MCRGTGEYEASRTLSRSYMCCEFVTRGQSLRKWKEIGRDEGRVDGEGTVYVEVALAGGWGAILLS